MVNRNEHRIDGRKPLRAAGGDWLVDHAADVNRRPTAGSDASSSESKIALLPFCSAARQLPQLDRVQ